jgi:hypothetical protein
MTFASSNPLSPARQFSLCGVISGSLGWGMISRAATGDHVPSLAPGGRKPPWDEIASGGSGRALPQGTGAAGALWGFGHAGDAEEMRVEWTQRRFFGRVRMSKLLRWRTDCTALFLRAALACQYSLYMARPQTNPAQRIRSPCNGKTLIPVMRSSRMVVRLCWAIRLRNLDRIALIPEEGVTP